MPTYDYSCKKCGEVFEVYQPITEDPLSKHPGCGGRVNRVFAPVGIVFKGSGFHKTDSRSSRSSGGGGAAGGETPAKPAKTDTTPATTSNGSDASGSKTTTTTPSTT